MYFEQFLGACTLKSWLKYYFGRFLTFFLFFRRKRRKTSEKVAPWVVYQLLGVKLLKAKTMVFQTCFLFFSEKSLKLAKNSFPTSFWVHKHPKEGFNTQRAFIINTYIIICINQVFYQILYSSWINNHQTFLQWANL